MTDVTILCPHCGYRLPGTPGRYDTCQECKKKIVWTKGRPYKNLIDVPNEPHAINAPASRRQHPAVPSTEYEPEQSSIIGFDGSEIFEFIQDHEVEPLNQKEKEKLAKEKKEQDHQKEEKKADVRVAPKWPYLPPLDDGTEMLIDNDRNRDEKERKNYWGWGRIDWDALERSMDEWGYEVSDYEDSYIGTSEITAGERRCKLAYEQGAKHWGIFGLFVGFVVGCGAFTFFFVYILKR